MSFEDQVFPLSSDRRIVPLSRRWVLAGFAKRRSPPAVDIVAWHTGETRVLSNLTLPKFSPPSTETATARQSHEFMWLLLRQGRRGSQLQRYTREELRGRIPFSYPITLSAIDRSSGYTHEGMVSLIRDELLLFFLSLLCVHVCEGRADFLILIMTEPSLSSARVHSSICSKIVCDRA